MAPVVIPYVPEFITVHLGPASQSAENVTVSFPDYIKNVASSEIYPTWELSALRANILAQISFALNRVYTEYYVSRGYPFQITSTTATDQKFIKGRNIFDNIDRLVDETTLMLDSTTIKVHQHASGAKKGDITRKPGGAGEA